MIRFNNRDRGISPTPLPAAVLPAILLLRFTPLNATRVKLPSLRRPAG